MLSLAKLFSTWTFLCAKKVTSHAVVVRDLHRCSATSYSTKTPPTDETLLLMTRLSKIHRNLEFAIDGVNHISASANLAFLERDPSQRGPRAQFNVDAAVSIRNNLNATLRDATRTISKEERKSGQSVQVLDRMRSLKSLLQYAEKAVRELHEHIRVAEEKLDKFDRGIQE